MRCSVEIQSPELCGRFTARVIRGVKIAPSPAWLRERLEASGVASISNVVDATNYVMLELGQPTHAYDYDKIRDHRIVVRTFARRREAAHTRRHRANRRRRHLRDRGRRWRACEWASAESWAAPTRRFRSRRRTFLIEAAWFEPIAVRRAARESAPAHRSFDAIRARRRSGDGRDRFAARGGIGFAAGGRRIARGRRRCVSGQARAEENSRDARRDFARDGRGRARQGSRVGAERAGICAGARRSESRRGRLAACDVGMHAAVVARGSRARNRFDRRDRADLRAR